MSEKIMLPVRLYGGPQDGDTLDVAADVVSSGYLSTGNDFTYRIQLVPGPGYIGYPATGRLVKVGARHSMSVREWEQTKGTTPQAFLRLVDALDRALEGELTGLEVRGSRCRELVEEPAFDAYSIRVSAYQVVGA